MRQADEARADELEARMGVVVGQLNAVHAELVDLITEAAATGAWEGWGVRSLCHWLTWQAGLSRSHALELIRLADAKITHPAITQAFRDGTLTVDQAAVAVKVPAHNDAEVAELAPLSTVTQLRTIVACSRPVAEPSAPDAPVESVSTWFDEDGRYQARISLDGDHGRVVDAALHAARDRLFRDGPTAVTWVDALLDVAHRSLDAEEPARRERFRVNVFIDPTADLTATWIDGTPLPGSAPTTGHVRRPDHPDVRRGRSPGLGGTVGHDDPRSHSPAGPAPRPRLPGAVVREHTWARDPSCRAPPGRWCPRHGQPRRPLPALPPAAPPGRAGHRRQRRRPRRADVHRPPWVHPHRRSPDHPAERAAPVTSPALRAPARRAPRPTLPAPLRPGQRPARPLDLTRGGSPAARSSGADRPRSRGRPWSSDRRAPDDGLDGPVDVLLDGRPP